MARNPASQPRLQKRPKGVPQSTRQQRMSKAIAKGGTPDGPVRLRLDARTTITCMPHMVAFWQTRYPNLTHLP